MLILAMGIVDDTCVIQLISLGVLWRVSALETVPWRR